MHTQLITNDQLINYQLTLTIRTHLHKWNQHMITLQSGNELSTLLAAASHASIHVRCDHERDQVEFSLDVDTAEDDERKAIAYYLRETLIVKLCCADNSIISSSHITL